MPVTKKKGAIFAIYADSPERGGSKASSSTATSTTSKSSLASKSDSPSPTKRVGALSKPSTSTAPRRALACLQPSSVQTVRTVEGKKGSSSSSSDPVKPTVKPASNETVVNPKRSVPSSTFSAQTTSRRPPPLYVSAKRQLQVFTSPSHADKPASSTREALGAGRTPPSLVPGASPPKKARATPQKSKRAFSIYTSPERPQKENVPPADSPASRTRSKTRVAATTMTGLHVAIGDEENVYPSSAGEMIGNGRETLTFKKARALGQLVAKSTAEVSTKSILSSKSTKSTKTFSVCADDILADVSEAYGASGEEPEGFRTAGVRKA